MKTALVTGASRGIGREVAQTLARDGWQVIAVVRNATSAPKQTRPEVVEMADPQSIAALARRLVKQDERLDALVNNAGMYTGHASDIWRVNVLGPLLLTRALDPLLAHGARVVMVTSGLGARAAQPASLVKRLSDPALSLEDIETLAAEAPGGYGASKAALNAMARVFAARFADRAILVNAVSPGWARTDMGGRNAPRSVQQGAASVLWGVTLSAAGPTGGVFEDGKPID